MKIHTYSKNQTELSTSGMYILFLGGKLAAFIVETKVYILDWGDTSDYASIDHWLQQKGASKDDAEIVYNGNDTMHRLRVEHKCLSDLIKSLETEIINLYQQQAEWCLDLMKQSDFLQNLSWVLYLNFDKDSCISLCAAPETEYIFPVHLDGRMLEKGVKIAVIKRQLYLNFADDKCALKFLAKYKPNFQIHLKHGHMQEITKLSQKSQKIKSVLEALNTRGG